MMNCREATRLMSRSMEEKLSPIQRMRLGFHMSMCKGCRNFNKQNHYLRELSHYFRKEDK